jgi:hypothetical protein
MFCLSRFKVLMMTDPNQRESTDEIARDAFRLHLGTCQPTTPTGVKIHASISPIKIESCTAA